MKPSKWLTVIIASIAIFLLIIVWVNFYIDTYGVRSSLFNPIQRQDTTKTFCATGMNQHISSPGHVFSRPHDFDSFIFGSSRTSVIDPSKIKSGKCFNMSYAVGLPAEHLAVVKAFLKKGIRVKTVIIGLDEFSFSVKPEEHRKQLAFIMHPYITDDSLGYLFYRYFFRMPKLSEIAVERKRWLSGERKDKCITDENGMNIGWINKEKIIISSGKPIFANEEIKYKPISYNSETLNAALKAIDELNILAHKNNFSLIVFINPIYNSIYLQNARELLTVKEKLAEVTNYYDFSGLNSVTTNDLSYLEENHYRYLVGDMIIKRITGYGDINVHDDFGILVTKKNINEHVKKQKLEEERYRAKNSL